MSNELIKLRVRQCIITSRTSLYLLAHTAPSGKHYMLMMMCDNLTYYISLGLNLHRFYSKAMLVHQVLDLLLVLKCIIHRISKFASNSKTHAHARYRNYFQKKF